MTMTCGLLLALPARAQTAQHLALAQAHAPVLLQETHEGGLKDLFAAFDFDGNWNGADNADHVRCYGNSAECPSGSACVGQACPLVATVYFSVVETATHAFIQYQPYHPLDWKVTNGHEHDTESILMVVRKDGGPGTLEAMEVRFHSNWYQYAGAGVGTAADNVDGPVHRGGDGRVMVYSQMVGHGLCGGYAPVNRLFPDLQLSCRHDEAPHVDTTGVIYRPNLPAVMPVVVDGMVVETGYSLVELSTSLWAHIGEIGPTAAFGESMDFTGERCADFPACPTGIGGKYNGNEGNAPSHAWGQEGGNGVTARGSQFFDPAYTMSLRLLFPAPFSLDYCWNPYVGITTGCDVEQDAGVVGMDASSTVDAGGEDAGTTLDASVPADGALSADGGGAGAPPLDGACGCSTASQGAGRVALVLWLGALLRWKKRRA